ncbi:dihydrodipicolinate synthase family protein [Tatumella citrea]|uniref:Dihydrodipicolinate synthase family protein n=1 Tax=Tatumella citrea TaxID=53336 RepID=A0A1Y0LNY7_TATCI|nr:dihydrodipicolinate synthase family protein [Tatumella citrea]ARU95696.1 dihydrodipicolinate synthase family protein [Tatumella citrea]ARU99737.1 dihydrodipicolinate synthase family protein [Tatumella citrea]
MSSSELPLYHGVYAATVCPMDEQGRHIDEPALAAHMRHLSQVPGIRGLLINGHAGENFALSLAEKKRVVEIAREVCPPEILLVAGINAEDSYDGQLQADDAKAAGADMLLIFPPYSWSLSTDSDTVLNHHRIINAHAQLPVMLYQAGVGTGGMAYPEELLAALVQLPQVVAVKEGSWETSAYDRNLRIVREVAPHVAMMASGDEHLMTCFALGTDGSVVSLAAVVPELVVALYQAMQNNQLTEARRLHQYIYPLAKEIYGTYPGTHANARLKACLHILGQIPHATPRPPVPVVGQAQREKLAELLNNAQSFSA